MTIQEVNDIPAERGINITNILLGLLLLFGGAFGSVIISVMSTMNTSIVSMDESISQIQLLSGVSANDIKHNQESISQCKIYHTDLEKRIRSLELNNHE